MPAEAVVRYKHINADHIEREKIFSSVIEQSFAFLYVLKMILCYMYFDNDLIMALKCMDFLLLVF